MQLKKFEIQQKETELVLRVFPLSPSLSPDDVVRPVGGAHDLRGDEDDVEEVAEEEEAQRGELSRWATIQYAHSPKEFPQMPMLTEIPAYFDSLKIDPRTERTPMFCTSFCLTRHLCLVVVCIEDQAYALRCSLRN